MASNKEIEIKFRVEDMRALGRKPTARVIGKETVTADGAALAYRVPVVLRDAEHAVLAVLPGNEQRCLLKFLSRLAANIDRSECAI